MTFLIRSTELPETWQCQILCDQMYGLVPLAKILRCIITWYIVVCFQSVLVPLTLFFWKCWPLRGLKASVKRDARICHDEKKQWYELGEWRLCTCRCTSSCVSCAPLISRNRLVVWRRQGSDKFQGGRRPKETQKRDIPYQANFMAQHIYDVTRDSIKPYKKTGLCFNERDVTGPTV